MDEESIIIKSVILDCINVVKARVTPETDEWFEEAVRNDNVLR